MKNRKKLDSYVGKFDSENSMMSSIGGSSSTRGSISAPRLSANIESSTESKQKEKKEANSGKILTVNLMMVLCGSMTTIFGKIMDQKVELTANTKGDDGALLVRETEFKHPLYMTLLMFIGEASLLIVLQFMHQSDPISALIHEKNKANPLLFIAPAFIDLCASFLSFTALAFIAASSYQILKMLCMVFVVLLSVTVLRRSYSMTQYCALVLIIGGLTTVTLTDITSASAVT